MSQGGMKVCYDQFVFVTKESQQVDIRVHDLCVKELFIEIAS